MAMPEASRSTAAAAASAPPRHPASPTKSVMINPATMATAAAVPNVEYPIRRNTGRRL
jgi:hypothetical protein